MRTMQLSLPFLRHVLKFILISSLLAANGLQASELTDQLKTLLDKQDNLSAYRLASQNRARHEGEPDFDFYYGMAAIDSGHVNEGVFALERVVYQQPNNHNARLELARGYYLQGDDTRARQAFERVLRVNPPKSVVANIERFLDAIRLREGRYRTTARGYIELETGHDTNINSGPDNSLMDGSLPWFALNDNLLELGDNFGGLAVGGQINHPISQHASLFGKIDATVRQHATEKQFDNDLVTVQAGAQWQTKQQRRRLGVILQRFGVDDTTTRTLRGLSAENSWLWSGQRQLAVSLSVSHLQHPLVPAKDSRQYMAGMQYLQASSQRHWFAALNLGAELPERDNEGVRRNLYAARLGGQWNLSSNTSAGITLGATLSDYKEPYFLGLLPARRETLATVGVSLDYLLDKHWKLLSSVSYQQNFANIDMFDYTRTQAKLGLRYEF